MILPRLILRAAPSHDVRLFSVSLLKIAIIASFHLHNSQPHSTRLALPSSSLLSFALFFLLNLSLSFPLLFFAFFIINS
jgi:hypothetical protein